MVTDKAGKAYWDTTEGNQHLRGRAFNGQTPGLRNFAKRKWHLLFTEAFSGIPAGHKLLEFGCGGSEYLPYFAREFGFKVSGIDYSASGCELAREICRMNGFSADIVCSDFFAAPAELKGSFDVVVSMGVVEHFTDAARVLSVFKTFLKPGGLMITSVPNLAGLPGAAQKFVNEEVFKKHVVFTVAALNSAHQSAGLTVRHCGYHLFSNFGVVNPGTCSFPRRLVWQGLRASTALSWAVESIVGSPAPGPLLSPYIVCVSAAPEQR